MKSEPYQIAKAMIPKIFEHSTIKIITGGFLSVINFFFDTVSGEALLALFILIIFDNITAIGASCRHGKKIESRKFRRTAVKIAYYFLLVSAGHLTEQAVPLLGGFIDETIIAFLAITELISILENTGEMGYAIPKKLLKHIRSYKDKC